MIQTITIDEKQTDFLEKFSQYGFKKQEDLINEALERLRRDLEQKSLAESANLYAEIYAEDIDLQELTELALLEKIND
jgi:hypothetical protein